AIMLFYDTQEADEMFRAAGFSDVDHYIQQAKPGSPRAITSVARVPEAETATATAEGTDAETADTAAD
ncbi:MAG: SAM-dependent methyltransferase, partial [Halobaculum sp.]